MCDKEHKLINLGFTEAQLPAGTHICQIYGDDDERNESLLKFITCGLQAKEKSACFSENVTDEMLDKHMAKEGISHSDAIEAGDFIHAGTNDVYFKNNKFDPDKMLEMLSAFYKSSVDEGYTAARVIGEMSNKIEHVEGGSRLLEYESRVSILLRDHPVTAVCQYNANEFDGATIMDVLKVHPMMVVRGSVINNPFYIPPEQILKKKV